MSGVSLSLSLSIYIYIYTCVWRRCIAAVDTRLHKYIHRRCRCLCRHIAMCLLPGKHLCYTVIGLYTTKDSRGKKTTAQWVSKDNSHQQRPLTISALPIMFIKLKKNGISVHCCLAVACIYRLGVCRCECVCVCVRVCVREGGVCV